MMDNIEKVLGLFFRRIPLGKILGEGMTGEQFTEKEFVELVRQYLDEYSDTELENMYGYLMENFLPKYYGIGRGEDMERGLNIFSLLKHYSDWVLTFYDNNEEDYEITCQYQKMFHWRNLSNSISEDLIVAAFLAGKEWNRPGKRNKFDWKPFISHNNDELRKIVKRGIAENHYHLKGSGPIYQLTWVSLMNELLSKEFREKIETIENERRNSNLKYDKDYEDPSFTTQILQAALIRLFLISILLDFKMEIGDCGDVSKSDKNLSKEEYSRQKSKQTEQKIRYFLNHPSEMELMRLDIQNWITTFRNINFEMEYPDYALNGIDLNFHDREKGLVYQGERWFLYEMLKAIYGKKPYLADYQDLFYAYLVIKENFRAEMIQVNQKVGFENFRIYQDRKEYFLESSFYGNLLVKEAIQSSIFDSNVVTLEARIAPKNSPEEWKKQLDKLDGIICGENENYKKRCFYTVHFIKGGKEKYVRQELVKCRHHSLRENVRNQCIALAELREKYPKYANRIRGIDAANTEIGCGPEVFATEFRYLKDHTGAEEIAQKYKIPHLKITYHVGEDFTDMISGLRAIDESICFLGMGCGSRMGHALVLGINPEEWYQAKNNRVFIPQQEYLDNVVWLHHILRAFQIPEANVLRDDLKRQFEYYFDLIYKGALHQSRIEFVRRKAEEYYRGTQWGYLYQGNSYHFDIEHYYQAWTLRGDFPQIYANGFYENRYVNEYMGERLAEHYVNKYFPIKQDVRYIQEVGLLYYLYHFDDNVRREGAKNMEIKIKKYWIDIIKLVQKELQRRISCFGIGIETNPSSNVLIGTFKRYDKHPILEFYNEGLTVDPEQLNKCNQLNVSINTDDQGVFNTSLENEYAYMALALEKAKDSEGNRIYNKRRIYQWLENIRLMGIRQTFLTEKELDELYSNKNY